MAKRNRTSQLSRFSVVAVGALALGPQVALGCGRGSDCHAETWSGTCQLETVTKVREAELPVPSVVIEAIYRPVSTGGQTLLLPDVRREFIARTMYEEALRAHVMAHSEARCYVNPPPPGQCNPGPMVLEVPEFDATQVQLPPEDTGPRGCAQIDSTSSQDRIAQSQAEAAAIEERFLFAESSAELPPDAASAASEIARRLKQDASIECVGVVGQYARGETLALAFERARAVRQLLIKEGVAPERLVALTVDRPVTTSTGAGDPPSPTDRRVSLSVLLKLAPRGDGQTP